MKFSLSCLLLNCSLFGCSGGRQVAPEEAGTTPEVSQDGDAGRESSLVFESEAIDLARAGRALDANDPMLAKKLLDQLPNTNRAGYLRGRVAEALGNYGEAVKQYRRLEGVWDFLESDRRERMIRALAASGKFGDAADQARALWEFDSHRPMISLKKEAASWLVKANRSAEAMALLEKARAGSKGRVREGVELRLADLYENNDRVDEAVRLVAPLSRSAETAGNMRKALELLINAEGEPKWTSRQRLDRAERLMKLRAWDDAALMLEPVIGSESSELALEAQWLNANLLFKRRRHYKEAIGALDKIIKDKHPKVDEAHFLKARALSRVDRDEEAIVEYRAFAKNTKLKGRAAEARFLASRLEFFLGKHKMARVNMESLVGNGKKAKKCALSASRVRDAHFIAGLSAILEGVPSRGESHLKAASKGSGSAEAIARNKYWFAVARLDGGKKDAASLLYSICDKDPTDWYALWAARRLEGAGMEKGSCTCEPIVSTEVESEGESDQKRELLSEDPEVALEELSSLAALYKSVGLFKDAAEALLIAEKKDKSKASVRDWLIHYVSLDAPQYAIRRANAGLAWPPSAENLWRAKSAYPSPFMELVKTEEERHGLPSFLIHSIARKESLFDPEAVSSVGAMGMMQMMPQTYETNRVRAGLEPLAEGELPGPEESIKAAGFELAHLLDKFGGSMPLAIMAYNGGSAAVSRWLERSGDFPMDVFVEKAGFGQTRNYVRRVYRNLVRYSILAGESLPPLPHKATPEVPTPTVQEGESNE